VVSYIVAGNELEVTKYLYENIGKDLPFLGAIKEIGYPTNCGVGAYLPIKNKSDINKVRTEGANKKADIYINGIGVSIKQAPTSPLYNRLQRDNIVSVFKAAGFSNIDRKIEDLDGYIAKYQYGELDSRDIAWNIVFNKNDFSDLLELLMMKYSPNLGFSEHPASFILEAPTPLISSNDIGVYTFENYFDAFKDRIVISLRRSWIGQTSNSEHRRALGLARKKGNAPWVFDGVSKKGGPRGWRADFDENQRKTVYYLIIYKNA